ncbi:LamG-like jellyroll fold domain-containing protein, partial [Planctomycetota bacterium]
DCGNAESLNITEKLTISAWVKTVDAGDPAGGEMGGQNHYVSKHSCYQFKHRTNLLIFAIWDGSPYATRISIDNSFNGEWHHVVGTYDGSVLKTYVDTKLEGEAPHVGDIDLIDLNVNIGKNPNQNDQNFQGAIDEVMIYARDLSESHVKDLFMGNTSFFLKAEKPQPEDGAIVEDTWVNLSWVPGESAISHDVYLGDTFNDVDGGAEKTFIGNQTATFLVVGFPGFPYPDGLVPGTTYYWRVDEIQADGTTIVGNVWSFTAAMLEAYDPRPRDGAKWVDPNSVELSWETGINATMHDVYFGTDKTAVETGQSDVFVNTSLTNTHTPGTLDKETTYYWRIDEHTTTGALNTGNVWTFTTSGGPNDGVKAEYFNNPDLEGQPTVVRAESLIDFSWTDGDVEGVNSPAEGIPTSAYSARWSAELHVAFSGVYRFVINVNNSGRLWLDDRLIIERWPNSGAYPEYTSKGVELVAGRSYSLVMEWNKYNAGALAKLEWIDPFGDRWVIPPGHLQLPLRANRPKPATEQIDVTHTAILTWNPGYKAARHEVYFGTDAEAVANANINSPEYIGSRDLGLESYEPGELQWNTTYYWRVDEVNDLASGSPWIGYVWSFTTGDFLVVDDFEGYDARNSQIWWAWKDGLGYVAHDEEPAYTGNGTGSAVGDETTSSFTEERIVHGGRQSMPLFYDNNKQGFKNYSEAELTLSAPRDWTVSDVEDLSLWFRGNMTNAAEPLYVAVIDMSGTAVVEYHDNPNATQADSWQKWVIPLQTFTDQGIDLTDVDRIAIGLGTRGNTTVPGGSGKMYFDDIRLYRPKTAP